MIDRPCFNDEQARAFLRRLFDAAVASAQPETAVPSHLPDKPAGRCIVVGAGKASAAMAAAVDAAWPDVDLSGVVVTQDGHALPAGRIEVLQAAHPVPDARGEAAARRMLAAVDGLRPDDLVLVLISGGGSALMTLPADGMTLADKQAVHRAFLASGATIGEMNTVRKHLSRIKGGRLAAAASPARLVTLVISDIPGDDPAMVASGPTVFSPGTIADAREIVARRGIDLPEAARLALDRGEDRPGPNAPQDVRIVAAPSLALEAAERSARDAGVRPVILGDAIEGEAREVGIVMAGIARSARRHDWPAGPPMVIVSGGETTVSIHAQSAGKGGRNTELLLSMGIALEGAPGIWALSCDTDGMDGTGEAAGALLAPDSLARAVRAGFDPRRHLQAHDSYVFFEAIGDLVRTGPTYTNVNDFRAILVG